MNITGLSGDIAEIMGTTSIIASLTNGVITEDVNWFGADVGKQADISGEVFWGRYIEGALRVEQVFALFGALPDNKPKWKIVFRDALGNDVTYKFLRAVSDEVTGLLNSNLERLDIS